jgi:hypothetical protein
MERALYFPHTTPRDKTVLKEALLLWDELEFIIPWDGFIDHHADRETRAALEIIGRPIAPSIPTKRRTHRRIKELIRDRLPSKYLFRPGERAAPIYADKLAPETWEMLLRGEMIAGEFRLRARSHSAHSYELAESFALAIMTILADECAGKTARKVTDAVYASDADAAYLRFGTRLPLIGSRRMSHQRPAVNCSRYSARGQLQSGALATLMQIDQNSIEWPKVMKSSSSKGKQ